MRMLTAIPVYNEEAHLEPVLAEVLRYAGDVLVVDDGSTDRTPDLLRKFPQVQVIRHPTKSGLRSRAPERLRADPRGGLRRSGHARLRRPARALDDPGDRRRAGRGRHRLGEPLPQGVRSHPAPPEQRRKINVEVTRWLNECLGLSLTDAFCGFKAYCASALEKFEISDDGYAMPLQVWVQAAAANLSIVEVAVPLIYLDESRAFGGALDDATYRLNHYRRVFHEALERAGLEVAGGCC